MLTKIRDWIDFFKGSAFYLKTGDGWKDKLEWVWAGLQDLVFYGGRTCNWHGELLCEKCYSKEFIKKVIDESITSMGDWDSPEAGTQAG